MNGYFKKGRFIEYGTEHDEWTKKINMIIAHILYENPGLKKYVGSLPIELKESFLDRPILRFGFSVRKISSIDTNHSDEYIIEHRIKSDLYDLENYLQKNVFESIKPNTGIPNIKVFGKEVYINRNIPIGIIAVNPDTYGELLRETNRNW